MNSEKYNIFSFLKRTEQEEEKRKFLSEQKLYRERKWQACIGSDEKEQRKAIFFLIDPLQERRMRRASSRKK